jgi:LmbE family N-acetylglucosaminyl deacetylase
MRDLVLDPELASGASVLLVGAHADDLEIGCGGTALRLVQASSNAHFYWVVLTSDPTRAEEARDAAAAVLAGAAASTVVVKGFRDGFLPYSGAEVKEYFEELKETVSPDLILTHHPDDAHQDHRLVSQLTRQTFRDHLVLEYEVPKYDGDLGQPNVFVELTEEQCRQKTRIVLDHFRSQRDRRWFREETFLAVMRLRGIECNAESGFAEAFYSRKARLRI